DRRRVDAIARNPGLEPLLVREHVPEARAPQKGPHGKARQEQAEDTALEGVAETCRQRQGALNRGHTVLYERYTARITHAVDMRRLEGRESECCQRACRRASLVPTVLVQPSRCLVLSTGAPWRDVSRAQAVYGLACPRVASSPRCVARITEKTLGVLHRAGS